MPHPRYRDTRTTGRRNARARVASAVENFAIRFAELALLAGLVGAGVALLVTRAA